MRIGRLVFSGPISGRILIPIAADQYFHAPVLQAVDPRCQKTRFLITHPASIVSRVMRIADYQQTAIRQAERSRQQASLQIEQAGKTAVRRLSIAR